jgi:hypothetical protein
MLSNLPIVDSRRIKVNWEPLCEQGVVYTADNSRTASSVKKYLGRILGFSFGAK